MEENAQSLKAKILAEDKEVAVARFEELIQIKNSFTLDELQDLYKEFKKFSHGGKFALYADIIFRCYPDVDKLRVQVERREQNSKKSITNFFTKKVSDDPDKRPREAEAAEKSDDKKSPKKKPAITDYFQKKNTK